jgi:hypothetical protein
MFSVPIAHDCLTLYQKGLLIFYIKNVKDDFEYRPGIVTVLLPFYAVKQNVLE